MLPTENCIVPSRSCNCGELLPFASRAHERWACSRCGAVDETSPVLITPDTARLLGWPESEITQATKPVGKAPLLGDPRCAVPDYVVKPVIEVKQDVVRAWRCNDCTRLYEREDDSTNYRCASCNATNCSQTQITIGQARAAGWSGELLDDYRVKFEPNWPKSITDQFPHVDPVDRSVGKILVYCERLLSRAAGLGAASNRLAQTHRDTLRSLAKELIGKYGFAAGSPFVAGEKQYELYTDPDGIVSIREHPELKPPDISKRETTVTTPRIDDDGYALDDPASTSISSWDKMIHAYLRSEQTHAPASVAELAAMLRSHFDFIDDRRVLSFLQRSENFVVDDQGFWSIRPRIDTTG